MKKPILCVCRTGARSVGMADVLKARGYQAVSCSIKAKEAVRVASQLVDVVFVAARPAGLKETVQELIDKPIVLVNMDRTAREDAVSAFEYSSGLPDSRR